MCVAHLIFFSTQQCSMTFCRRREKEVVRKISSFHERECPKDSCHGPQDLLIPQTVDNGVEHRGEHGVEDSQTLIFCGRTETPRLKIKVGKRCIIKCHHS